LPTQATWASVPFFACLDKTSYSGEPAIEISLEKIIYTLFGTNLVIGPQIKEQIRLLKANVPGEFQRRELDDLGCGDGKVTVLLRDIFLPERLRGFDVNAGLVKRARQRGIDAAVKNLDREMPSGELGMMWGVLHHLDDPAACIERIKANYPMVFIREPLRTGRVSWLETGRPLRKEELEPLISGHLPGAKVYHCGNSMLAFYVNPALTKR
jgi:hypothetical protein